MVPGEPKLLGLLAELPREVATGQCRAQWSRRWLSPGKAVCAVDVLAPAVLQGRVIIAAFQLKQAQKGRVTGHWRNS